MPTSWAMLSSGIKTCTLHINGRLASIYKSFIFSALTTYPRPSWIILQASLMAQFFCKRSRSRFRLKIFEPESGSLLIGWSCQGSFVFWDHSQQPMIVYEVSWLNFDNVRLYHAHYHFQDLYPLSLNRDRDRLQKCWVLYKKIKAIKPGQFFSGSFSTANVRRYSLKNVPNDRGKSGLPRKGTRSAAWNIQGKNSKFAGNFVMARLNFKVAGQFPSCIVFFKSQQYIFVGYALAAYREIPKYFGPVQHVHTVQAGSPCRKLEWGLHVTFVPASKAWIRCTLPKYLGMSDMGNV